MAEPTDEWDVEEVRRFQEQRRCMGCKKLCQGKMVKCEKCQEFQYCTIFCLEAQRKRHKLICDDIGLKKGILRRCVGKEKERLDFIIAQAKLLDDEGNQKTLKQLFPAIYRSRESSSDLPEKSEDEPKGDNSEPTGTKKKKRHNKKKKGKKPENSNDNGKNNNNNSSSSSNNNSNSSNNNKTNNYKSQSSVESLITGGQFGGPGRVHAKVESGVKFGEGWWKAVPNKASQSSETSSSKSGTKSEARFGESWWKQQPNMDAKNSGASASTSGAKGDTKGHEDGSRTKPKFSDLYDDSEDEEPTTIRRERRSGDGIRATEASRCSPSSSSTLISADVTSGATAAEDVSGLEVVSYDAEVAEEQEKKSQAEGGSSSKLGKCDFCDTRGFVLTCGRCKTATYCDKSCQKQHFPDHKDECKRFEKFNKALVKTQMTRGLLAMFGCHTAARVSPCLSDLADRMTHMFFGATHSIMLEIVGPHPNMFQHGAFVRDIRGQVTQILFYDHRTLYRDISSGMLGILNPIPLSVCLRPGNFILLLDSHWHHFLDGTVGIRIDDIDSVQFIFMDN